MVIYISDYIILNGELYHHGILGQKWGVRRYQNKDGSYTQAGIKKRRLRKLERYTNRETKKLDKQITSIEKRRDKQYDRYQKKIDKAEGSGKQEKADRLTQKQEVAQYRKEIQKGYRELERMSVQSMSYLDMKREKNIRVNRILRNMTLSAVATASFVLAGVPAPVIVRVSPQRKVRQDRYDRLGDNGVENIPNIAAQRVEEYRKSR